MIEKLRHWRHGGDARTPTHVGTRVLEFFSVSSVVLLCAVLVTGCTRAKAKTVPDAPPPLDMPAPPPRDVETNESEPPPPVLLPQEPARSAPPRTRPAPAQPRPADIPKPAEAPKPETPTEGEPVRPPEEAPKPPSILQATPPQVEGEVERNVRATLSRATSDLNRVDYRLLNADARGQYNTAKSFIEQADAAVRSKNLQYAKTLADKAAALAAQLSGK